jgi:ATP-dependent helicase HrpB
VTFPIDPILPDLMQVLLKNPAVVLHAPPGAGKTTRVPLELLAALPGRIIMLEPRRIAAITAASWMARSLSEEVGATVGYTIRFDSRVSAATRIEVATEGVLTRRIQSDPELKGVSLVIFDEFHERSIHADLALALCLDIWKSLREDLKILIMSATLDCGPVAALLGNAPIVSSTGRAFPVEERFRDPGPGPVAMTTAAAIRAALRETNGDILAFLPGAREIRSCADSLRQSMDLIEERLSLCPLYGDLPFEEQERAILPSRDRRKIVIATNIAETSLTIEGVHVVIDSGLTRRLTSDPATGMNRLVTVPVSRDSAEQRKGRAGRLGPGVCYRLYPQQELQSRPAFAPPEILVCDLSPLALELAAWGVTSPSALAWLDPPPPAAWRSASRLLRNLGALDMHGSITALGRSMAGLPVHPRLSRLITRASELGCTQTGADLAAILSERDLVRKGLEQSAKEPDLSERLEMLRSWRRTRHAGGVADASALRTVDRAASHLLRLAGGGPTHIDDGIDQDLISRILLAAFPDRVCKRREEGVGRYIMATGRGVRLSRDSHLLNNRFIIAVTTDAGEGAEGFVHIAAPVTEGLVRDELSGAIERVRVVEWNSGEKRIVAAVQERLGTLTLSLRPFTPDDEEAGPILCEAIRNTPGLIYFSAEARQLQARAELMRRVFPEEGWPDLSPERLTVRPEEWLTPSLGGLRTAQHLRTLNVVPALKALLNWEQKRQLDVRAPASITVPSGSRVAIDYTSSQPVLAVKLQEMFGLADTPAIAEGRVKLLLHLLSPARRPVQVTQDLKGFWNGGYPLVKKDLKGRYPKHPWPDDPWNAVPTKRTKPKGT